MLAVVAGLSLLSSSAEAAYLRPARTEVISVSSDEVWGRDPGRPPDMSGSCGVVCETDVSDDGRFVAFASDAADLVEGDTNQVVDVFVRDRKLGTTERVSVASDGSEAIGACVSATNVSISFGSRHASISGNGRYVVFTSCAVNLTVLDEKTSADVFVHDRKTGTTQLVSLSSEEVPALCVPGTAASCNGSQIAQAISRDGRFITFNSYAPNLVIGDTNNFIDMFVRDRKLETTERVSVSSDGAEGIYHSLPGVINASGRYVLFLSQAGNLGADPNGQNLGEDYRDVYLHDLQEGTTTQVDVNSEGVEEKVSLIDIETLRYLNLAISDDGQEVAFTSRWPGFVPNDTNDAYDVFVKNMRTGEVERVSVESSGQEAASWSLGHLDFSNDARHIVFSTSANIAPDDTEGSELCGAKSGLRTCGVKLNNAGAQLLQGLDEDVYVYDRFTGSAELITRDFNNNTTCEQENPVECPGWTTSGSIDATGRYVAFESDSHELVEQQDGYRGPYDTFLRDRGRVLEVGDLNTGGPGVALHIPGVSSGVQASQAVVEDDNDTSALQPDADLLGATIVHRPVTSDLFLKLDLESMTGPFGRAGDPSLVYGWRFAADGTSYEIRAARIGALGSPFEAAFGLFRCELVCSQVAELEGGFGTIGESIVVSMPLQLVGLEGGGSMADTAAFVGVGSFYSGAATALDHLSL